MDKLKQYFSLAIVFWSAADLSQIALAQYWVPMQPPVPRHDTMFPRRNRPNNNNGSDPAPRFRPSNNSPSEPAIKKNNYETIIGVGIQMRQDKKTRLLIVDNIVQGSSAASVGIRSRDVITQIDNLSASGMTIEQAVKLIRGSIGTQVTLKVLRNGQPLAFTMTRTRLIVQSR